MLAKAEVTQFPSPAQPAPQPQPQAERSTIRTAGNRTPGRFLFYIGSESRPGREHAVQHIRRGHRRFWNCSCEDYQFRRLPHRRHCRHIRLTRELVSMAHGLRRLTVAIARLKGGPA